MRSKTQLNKPVLSHDAVNEFVEAPVKPTKGHTKANVSQGITDSEKSPSADTDKPKFRLTMNIEKSTHMKLKLNAARQDITMTDLIERLVTEHLDD